MTIRTAFLFYFFPFTTLVNAQSLNMSFVCSWDNDNLNSSSGAFFNDIWGYSDNLGNEVAILGGIDDVFFINATTCQLIDSLHITNAGGGTDNNSLWRDFKTYGTYAYAVADQESSGLIVFDLSNIPTSVTQVYQSNAVFNRCHNIFIDELNGRLYAVGTNTLGQGVHIFDISAPNQASPVLLESVTLPGGYVHDIYVKDHIGYCSHGNNGLYVYDFEVAASPVVMGTIVTYPEQGYNHSSWTNLNNNYLVFADETHGKSLKRVPITIDHSNQVVTFGEIDLFKSQLIPGGNSIAHNPFVKGNLVFVSYYHDGVQVFDISDPDTVTKVAYYDTYPANNNYVGYDGAWGVYPFLPSGNIIASDQENGLQVLTIGDDLLPIEYLDFSATRKESEVRLEWHVTGSGFGDYYLVERGAADGNFNEIERVEFQENIQTHQVVDHQPAEESVNLYRIRLINLDGSNSISPVRAVNFYNREEFSVAGNLVTDEIEIRGPHKIESRSIRVFQSNGVQIENLNWLSGESIQKFNVGHLPPGSYILETTYMDGEKWVDRFVKQ